MTCILSHYARCFCVRVLGKDIDFVPLGAVYLVLGCTCNTNAYGLGRSSNGMLSNMDAIIVSAWIFW